MPGISEREKHLMLWRLRVLARDAFQRAARDFADDPNKENWRRLKEASDAHQFACYIVPRERLEELAALPNAWDHLRREALAYFKDYEDE